MKQEEIKAFFNAGAKSALNTIKIKEFFTELLTIPRDQVKDVQIEHTDDGLVITAVGIDTKILLSTKLNNLL